MFESNSIEKTFLCNNTKVISLKFAFAVTIKYVKSVPLECVQV